MTSAAKLVLELRQAAGLTQEQTADQSGGRLTRMDINKIEAGANKATTDRVRAGLADAFGVTRDVMADYLEGRIALPAALAARESPTDQAVRLPILRHHPQWAQLVREAHRLRPSLSEEDFERIADSPFLWGPPDSLDAALVAELAAAVKEWAARRALTGGA